MQKAIVLRPTARILVVKLAGIGDLLLATPALRALRESYPLAIIDLLVTPDSAGLLNGWEMINNVIVLDKYLFDYPKQILTQPQNLSRLLPIWRSLRGGHYDAVLLMHQISDFLHSQGRWWRCYCFHLLNSNRHTDIRATVDKIMGGQIVAQVSRMGCRANKPANTALPVSEICLDALDFLVYCLW